MMCVFMCMYARKLNTNENTTLGEHSPLWQILPKCFLIEASGTKTIGRQTDFFVYIYKKITKFRKGRTVSQGRSLTENGYSQSLRSQLHYTGLLAYRITYRIGMGLELHYSAVIRYITFRESGTKSPCSEGDMKSDPLRSLAV